MNTIAPAGRHVERAIRPPLSDQREAGRLPALQGSSRQIGVGCAVWAVGLLLGGASAAGAPPGEAPVNGTENVMNTECDNAGPCDSGNVILHSTANHRTWSTT